MGSGSKLQQKEGLWSLGEGEGREERGWKGGRERREKEEGEWGKPGSSVLRFRVGTILGAV